MNALLSTALLLALVAGGDDLDAVLQGIRATKDAPREERLPWVEKLVAIESRQAKKAALSLYEGEADQELKARLLDHAAGLPKLDPSVNLDTRMLGELERGLGLGIRVVAARYFVEQRGNDGIDLCEALLAETKDAEMRQAVLAAYGTQPHGTRAATLFRRRWDQTPPTSRLAVLKELRGRRATHVDQVRRAALDDPYLKLRGEAMSQLAAIGDASIAGVARKMTKGKAAATLAPILFEVLTREPKEGDLDTIGSLLAHQSSRMRSLAKDAVARLVQHDWAKEWATGDGRTHRDAAVRSLAVRLLAALPDDATVREALYDLASDTEADNRRRAVFALARLRDRRIVSLLEKHLQRGHIDRRLDALQALDLVLGEEETFQRRLVDLASSGPAELRLLATELAGKRGVGALAANLPAMLANSDWRVRAAGIRYAGRVRDKASIPLLIDLLQKEKGRLADDLRTALSSLTRLFFQRPEDWRRWWQKEGATFELPPAGDEPKAGSAAPANAADRATSAVFYGIPVVSERVAFCLDVSGSMAKLAGTGIARLKIAQQSLLQALQRCPKTTFANVLFFDNKVHPYSKRMVSLRSSKTLDKIKTFAGNQKALGGTNIYDALVHALSDRRVDTVFLLSDGEPTEGEITDPTELAEEIALKNRGRGVVIHTVAIGGPSALLQRLANDSGGRYVVQK